MSVILQYTHQCFQTVENVLVVNIWGFELLVTKQGFWRHYRGKEELVMDICPCYLTFKTQSAVAALETAAWDEVTLLYNSSYCSQSWGADWLFNFKIVVLSAGRQPKNKTGSTEYYCVVMIQFTRIWNTVLFKGKHGVYGKFRANSVLQLRNSCMRQRCGCTRS